MNTKVKTLKAEVRDVLENNILDFWLHHMVDEENGGFYGQMTGEGELIKTADKGGILNARILWSFSAAYRVLKKTEYLEKMLHHFARDFAEFSAARRRGSGSRRSQGYHLGFGR